MSLSKPGTELLSPISMSTDELVLKNWVGGKRCITIERETTSSKGLKSLKSKDDWVSHIEVLGKGKM